MRNKTRKKKYNTSRPKKGGSNKICSKGGLAFLLCNDAIKKPLPGYKCKKKCKKKYVGPSPVPYNCKWTLESNDKMAW